MSRDERFVIVTNHGTILHKDRSKGLTHERDFDFESAIIVNEKGQLASGDLISFRNDNKIGVIFDRRADAALICDNFYLCALPDGTFGLREQFADWEKFRFAPLHLLLSPRSDDKTLVSKKQFKDAIPKIIHQTFSSEKLPARFDNNVRNIQEQNPGWIYRYWSDKMVFDFIYEYYGLEMLNKYLSISPLYGAARADLFRYLCVYNFGGVYIDIKSACKKPFDEFIRADDSFLISQWLHGEGRKHDRWGLYPDLKGISGGEYQQWHLISAPGHPFLLSVIERVINNISYYDRNLCGTGKMATLRLTGPIAYTLAIHDIVDMHQYRRFCAEEVGMLYDAVGGAETDIQKHYSKQTDPLVYK